MVWLLGLPLTGSATDHTIRSARFGSADVDSGAAVLRRLDAVIAADPSGSSLLPRAPQVVPQLMKSLRDDNFSSVEVATRVSKDVLLATEIIRLANSARNAGGQPVVDLQHALAAVGSDGLRQTIAKVVLRPIFEVRGDSLAARAAPQIWSDADTKSQLGAAIAASAGLDPLDGYFAGLLHNTGWSAALRAIDGLQSGEPAAGLPGLLLGPEFIAQLMRRRDACFATLVRPWHVSPALDLLAEELATDALAAARSPLGRVLVLADRLAGELALQRLGLLTPEAAWPLDSLAAQVRACCIRLARA